MTKRLEEVVAAVRSLPEDEQDRAADAFAAFLCHLQDYLAAGWLSSAWVYLPNKRSEF